MSIDAVILAKQPLPPRDGGWQGYRGPAPLWYAAVDMRVSPYVAGRRPNLDSFVAGQGGAAEVISLNWKFRASEFASDYCSLLCQLTGGTVLVEGNLTSRCPAPRIATVAELEQRLFRVDMTELDCLCAEGSPPEPWEADLDDELFELTFGRPRPNRGPKPDGGIFLLKKELSADELPALTGVRAVRVPFMDWARQDHSRIAQVVQEGGRGIKLGALAQVLWFEVDTHWFKTDRSADAVWSAFERLHDRLLDVNKARVLYEVW
jgi:hypothetical protein